MSLHDDSQILSQLGILVSKDESPHKIHYSSKSKMGTGKDRFVDVNIDGSIDLKSDSDEEAVFDRNTLLSPNKNVKSYRGKPDTYKCMYIILSLIYCCVGVWYPLILYVTISSKEVIHGSVFENSIGLLLGSVFAKLSCKRMNIVLLSFFCAALLCVLSWTLPYFPEMDVNISSFLIGFASGNLFYEGMAMWLIFYRGCNRKGLFLYVVLTTSSSLILFLNNSTFLSGEFSRFQVTTHKREIVNGSSMVIGNSVEFEPVNYSIVARPRKPQVVQGITNMESKSEQNNQMRKATERSKTPIFNVASTEISNNTAISRTENYREFNEKNVVATTSYISTTITLDAAVATLYWSSTSLPENASSPMDGLIGSRSTLEYVTNVIISAITICYLMGFICCCIPFTLKADTRFFKLFDPTIAGLTKGCRLRLATFQIIASALENLVELAAIVFSSERSTYNIYALHCIAAVISRLFAFIGGSCAYSFLGCCLALIFFSLGSILLLPAFNFPIASFFLMTVGSKVLGLLIFFYLEIRIYPRSGTQLDYFIMPSIIGRLLVAMFCTLQQPTAESEITGFILLSSGLLVVLFFLLARSVSKAARLKEIMEYSSSPVFDACDEYVSLIERDVGSDSLEDKDEVIVS